MSTFKKKSFRKKRSFGKRKLKSFIKKRGGKFSANAGMVTYFGPQQLPFAPRYRAKFQCDNIGNIAAGAASGQFYIRMNSLYTPYTGGNFPNPLNAIATLNPTGFSSVVNANLYLNYRVYASVIKIQFIPQALTDSVEVTVTPAPVDSHPTNVQTAMAQPFTKKMMYNSSQNSPVLVNSITQHRLLGVKARAIEDDLSGNYTGTYTSVPTNQLFWVINWGTPDAVNTVNPISVRCSMTYYAELWNDASALLKET